jgi:hypothetical protein
MSSKYAKKYKIPDELESIVVRFTREVLRYQPQDILEFAIEYFKGLEENQKLNDFHKKEEHYMSDEKQQDNKESDLVQVQEKGTNEAIKEDEPGQDDLVTTVEGGRHKRLYDEWFIKHSIVKPIIIPSFEEETKEENLKRIQIGYEQWFNKHCVKGSSQVQSGEINKVEKSRAIDENKEEGKASKDDYDDWFNRHSNDKIKIKYIPEKTEYEENNRYQMDYNSWFTNHSK